MGPKLWGVDIQAEIGAAATSSDLPNFYLRKLATGIADPDNLAAGTNDGPPIDYACHGVISDYDTSEILDQPLVQRGDKKINIIAKPLADAGVEPAPEDLIIDGTTTYTIIAVKGNSAKAVWQCQCRG